MPETAQKADFPVARFAPSPTGRLHIGHAIAAREAFQFADDHGGKCLLRIEDIDQTRCKPEFEAGIYDDLNWLGFDWPEPVRRQSDYFDDYTRALGELREKELVYRSFLTRKELNADLEERGIGESPAGERPYPGPIARMSFDEEEMKVERGDSFAWRLSLSACRDYLGAAFNDLSFVEEGAGVMAGEIKAHPAWLGDVVLARKDTPTSYHLAVTHDDALQGISHVVRGRDLYFSTHIHVLLQRLFDWPTPVYRHHGLILDTAGKKFSKSDRSRTLESLRKEGVRPEQIFRDWALS
ncbi:tRNA glutamyl-Q(34) synthetase GluQRS [Ponticaulis koreensis]|uniref:tRNA glutamyl-Q(34) synthetase GluQRS n=1 Tax=Ponticaulis koreensis TaxID=1123045 RepID=UPI0003B3F086|nr:tRNA glutamyl-Q(34) synthetase GluQRS [Ponticaulis koreensis]